MSDLLLNRTIKHYRIEKVLGAGGMGAVYRAIDLQLQRPVAIKVMHPNFAIQPEFQQRFLQEARASAALDHPNIIRIYEFDLDNNMLYMVTELVSGGSLRDYLKQLYEQRKFIEVSEALALTRQVADALGYAHQQGLVHRDVKPDNVLLKAASSSDEAIAFRAILTDFGLAKLAEGGVQSVVNNPTGTLPYMSPEQAMADKLDGRTDLYALGVMLYELTTGRLPFLPQNLPEAIKMHTTVQPERPTAVRASLSPALEEVILKAMAKNPKDRYQSGAELAKAIRQVEAVGGQVKRGADGGKKQAEAAPEKVESLSTYLQSMAQAAAMSPSPEMPQNTSANDRLVITTEGEAPRFYELTKNVIEIGRDPQLDLSLTSPKVSRHHARLERRKDGQYTIMDLGSSNGTYLGDAKLLSNIPEVWTLDKPVRLGNFWLTLQRAAQNFGTVAPVRAAPSIAPPGFGPGVPGLGVPIGGAQATIGQGGAQGGQGGIMMTLNPPAVTLEAGARMDIRVEIRNLSELVEHYQFHIDGIPKEWYTLPMTTLQLMPSREGDAVSKGNVNIAFHPPRNCKSTSGTHNITIRVTSQDRGKEVGRAQAMLTINPFYQFEGDLQPKRIRNRGELRIVITNKGNAPESFTLTPLDREEALHFDPPTQSITALPCLEEIALFYVRPIRRPLIAFRSRHYSFEVNAEASVGTSQALPAELISAPRIPWILLVLLLLLCLLCLLPIALLYPCPTNFFKVNQCPITVTPNLPATNAHATLDTWLTATANQFTDRQTATGEARNATATQAAVVQSTATAAAQSSATNQVVHITETGIANIAATAKQADINLRVQQTQTAQAPTATPAPK